MADAQFTRSQKERAMRRSTPKVNHHTMPLRRIVRREVQNGMKVTVLVCGHASPGQPDTRFAKFYPCIACHQVVKAIQAKAGAGKAAALEALRQAKPTVAVTPNAKRAWLDELDRRINPRRRK